MFSRLLTAFLRAVLVALVVAMPSLILVDSTTAEPQIVALVAIFAGLFTFVEYSASSPSIIEFRDAPPYNRLRFLSLFVTVAVLSFVVRGVDAEVGIERLAYLVFETLGGAFDFPFSPVRLMILMFPADTDPAMLESLRVTAGISYLISLLCIANFIILLRLRRWPNRRATFNVWVNLPTFDPTAGGDVVARLNRDSQINVILGFLLPFIIPAIGKLISIFITPISFSNPQTMIWIVTAWAFLPASLLMRGVALSRVAYMIHKQRKRAYAKAVEEGMLPV